jgi:hypothetical protein
VSDLTFQKDELDKITQIVYARILTEKDRIFKQGIEDEIEEHIKQSV